MECNIINNLMYLYNINIKNVKYSYDININNLMYDYDGIHKYW